MFEDFYLNKKKILKKSHQYFLDTLKRSSDFKSIKIGCELELYLFDQNNFPIIDQEKLENFISAINAKKEQGISQIEILINYGEDLEKICEEIDSKKNLIFDISKKNNLIANFNCKPINDDCSSSLQYNISLHDNNDDNIFYYNKKYLKYCANSLLKYSNSMVAILCPSEIDYIRFSEKLNFDLFLKGKYTAPVNLSLGLDNRTCAVRIPNSIKSNKSQRLEYRIASSNSDQWLSISCILLVLSKAMIEKEDLFPIIYGNAFDKQYNLEKICTNIKIATDNFDNSFIKKKFMEFIL